MDYSNIIMAVCTSITTTIAIVALVGRKFDKIDKRFDKLDERFDKVDEEIKLVRQDINKLDARLSHVEGYLYRDSEIKKTTGS